MRFASRRTSSPILGRTMNGSKHGEGAKRSANILASFRPGMCSKSSKSLQRAVSLHYIFFLQKLSLKSVTLTKMCTTRISIHIMPQYLVTYYDVCWSEGDISLSLSRDVSTRTYAHVKSRLIAFDRRVEPPKTRSLAKVTWLPNGRPLTSLSLHVVMVSTER